MVSKKTKKKNVPEEEMNFWGHLEELRKHIIRSIIAVLILSIGAFISREFIFDTIILAPKNPNFITNILFCNFADLINIDALCINNNNLEIINLEMSGQFLTHIYISIMVGIIVAVPYIVGEIWAFILPALNTKEKESITLPVFVTSILFITGVLFSYYLIVPLTINFFGSYQVSATVVNTIALKSYISTVVSLTFAVGIVFELPIFVFFLTKIGLLTPDFMKKNRRIMLVVTLIISAIITPADIFSQIMVAVPLYALYEFSIGISKYEFKKQQKKVIHN